MNSHCYFYFMVVKTHSRTCKCEKWFTIFNQLKCTIFAREDFCTVCHLVLYVLWHVKQLKWFLQKQLILYFEFYTLSDTYFESQNNSLTSN